MSGENKQIGSAEDLLEQRIAMARRMKERYGAEENGLLRALVGAMPVPYSSDHDLQKCFMRGFEDGRAILTGHAVAEVLTCSHASGSAGGVYVGNNPRETEVSQS